MTTEQTTRPILVCGSCGASPSLFPDRTFWVWPDGDPWAGETACSGCWVPPTAAAIARCRGFVDDTNQGRWITPAQRQRAYQSGDLLAKIAGAEAPVTTDDLDALVRAFDAAERRRTA